MLKLEPLPDDIAATVLIRYSTVGFKPPPRQFTILAAFVLSASSSSIIKVISLGTGTKCMPAVRLFKEGNALHDSHAEVLARRGAVRWFLEEIGRTCSSADKTSCWLHQLSDGKFALKTGIEIVLYISTVPCGDASMRYLATFQDADMAALKNSTQFPELPPNMASRGRDNYSLHGVLRTKPGRADSPPTISMSCSDKIARWNVLGFQGALASRFLHPLYIDRVIIGDVEDHMRDIVQADCERALWQRLTVLDDQLPAGYELRRPVVQFTSVPYPHSRTSLAAQEANCSCNDSLCWFADSTRPHEVLINGVKRGVPPKYLHSPKFRPQLCKLSLLNLIHRTAEQCGCPNSSISSSSTYYEHKQAMSGYQNTKSVLQSPQGPFAGWVKSGAQWESFDADGVYHECEATTHE